MNQFRFEQTMRLTDAEYIVVWSPASTHSSVRTVRLLALIIVGTILLFNPYTLVVGAVLLLLLAVNFFKPGLMGVGTRSTFHQQKYLRKALTFGVSDEKLWVSGDEIEASAAWSLLSVWRETNGLFILSASGIPPVYLPVAQLKEEGVYEKVRALAQEHGKEFDAKMRPHAI
jgi:hypothetical protein